MDTMMQENRYTLAARELLALSTSSPSIVRCLDGELWITQAGDQRDIILRPGESWHDEANNDEIVISALRASTLTLAHESAGTRPATPRREGAAWTLAALRRWKHPPLAILPASLLR